MQGAVEPVPLITRRSPATAAVRHLQMRGDSRLSRHHSTWEEPMWEYEYSLDTAATPDTLWRYWSDLTTWPQWNDGIEKIAINGPFAAGTIFTMTPPEG